MPRRVRQSKHKTVKHQAKGNGSSGPRRIVNLGTLWPDRAITKMVYSEVVYRAPALAITDERQFILNSTYAPYPGGAGGGHQPMGRDQFLGTIYNKYRVRTVKVTIQWAPLYQSYIGSCIYVVPSNDTTALNGTLTLAAEQPMAWTNLTPFGAPVPTYQRKLNLWDIWGKSKEQYLSDDITASNYTTSPVESIVLKVGMSSSDATQVVVYSFQILLEQEVECFDRASQPQS